MARILAFYLPQYHRIPENDRWWGNGFTDWENLKKAKPIYKNQIQPRIPLNHNYYDLTDVNTLKWQANLANKYGIYGFCIYHYWFNEKLLLEKPAEILLDNTDINVHFCFSWANETWSRTWTGNESQILIKQTYGGKKEWINHFNYLLPFFKDSRYIKENNKPMFVIYKSGSIPNCKEMMETWDNLAKKVGFDGIHFVETLNRGISEDRQLPFSAKVEFEPSSIKNQLKLNKIRVRRYAARFLNKWFKTKIPETKKRNFSSEIKNLKNKIYSSDTYPGLFVGWDNTPRRGLAATVISTPTKNQFKEYLMQIMWKANTINIPYIFINAWNEWAEGTYLEPDIHNKYAFLEAIKEVQDEIK